MKPELEVFKSREDNMFKEFNNSEELLRYYQDYVRKYGTSYSINDQYIRRMSELDIIEFCKGYKKKTPNI